MTITLSKPVGYGHRPIRKSLLVHNELRHIVVGFNDVRGEYERIEVNEVNGCNIIKSTDHRYNISQPFSDEELEDIALFLSSQPTIDFDKKYEIK